MTSNASDYQVFFSVTGTICAGLWIVYPTVMMVMATMRFRRISAEEFVLWSSVILSLQAGSSFAEAMLICLRRLVPNDAMPDVLSTINTLAWWLIAVPVAVALWRLAVEVRARGKWPSQLGFAAFTFILVYWTSTIALRAFAATAPKGTVTAVMRLLELGILTATIATFVTFRVASTLGAE